MNRHSGLGRDRRYAEIAGWLILIMAAVIIVIALAGCDSPAEDDPGWDCSTMGNRSCGATPTTSPTSRAGKFPTSPVPTLSATPSYAAAVTISLKRYPNVGDHVQDAIKAGESAVCTLDREGADERRDDAVKGHPTAKGMDRDEYPFAVCLEGGAGADVRLVPSSENRSSGAWLGNQLEPHPDGTRVLIVVR